MTSVLASRANLFFNFKSHVKQQPN